MKMKETKTNCGIPNSIIERTWQIEIKSYYLNLFLLHLTIEPILEDTLRHEQVRDSFCV